MASFWLVFDLRGPSKHEYAKVRKNRRNQFAEEDEENFFAQYFDVI